MQVWALVIDPSNMTVLVNQDRKIPQGEVKPEHKLSRTAAKQILLAQTGYEALKLTHLYTGYDHRQIPTIVFRCYIKDASKDKMWLPLHSFSHVDLMDIIKDLI